VTRVDCFGYADHALPSKCDTSLNDAARNGTNPSNDAGPKLLVVGQLEVRIGNTDFDLGASNAWRFQSVG